ncbi:hypothetical protein CLAFUW4_12177 [Fulvia fulva]|uniref:Uncharacterized protein n=1 Tax=Passalora fulva TaxID=5499 RepID=A0A9Q8PEY8_PASFU|nr:uncharacterized protein CLAFUR5_11214 [Fulvia fulva]KAK4618638.1 hypothetical protein CLAFUR0_12193 [Fulvia fulva]UJO21225.1 hypothetical protein CLAFUR5_11214 [Fulvia fulva]WPV17861.1 hypothetical protein CLAFUW4_12177 [Fulvia fulva]WPV33253.1 hypothetical protein CLAFUW7_12184 [Fulvia fulva]
MASEMFKKQKQRIPHKKGREVFANFKAAGWNRDQLAVVKSSKSLTYKHQLVQGAGGSGKTKLMTAKGHEISTTGNEYVLYTTERNSICDNLLDVYVKHYPEDQAPLRAFAQGASLSEMTGKQDSAGEVNPAEVVMYELLKKRQQDRSSARTQRMRFTVEHHIIQAIQDGKIQQVQLTSDEKGEEGKNKPHPDHPDPVNVFKYFNELLEEAKLHPLGEMVALRVDSDATKHSVAKLMDPTHPSNGEAKNGPDGGEAPAAELDKQEVQHDQTAPAVMKLPPLVPEDVSDLKSDAGEGLQLSEAKTGPYRPSDRLRLVGRALKACRKNVIASAKVLIATLATVGSDDIRKYWAPDRSHQVWAEIDEATTIPEVMFYVPHANCYSTWGKRIVSTVQYGDHRQLAHALWHPITQKYYNRRISTLAKAPSFGLDGDDVAMVKKARNWPETTNDDLDEFQQHWLWLEVEGTRWAKDESFTLHS